MARKRANPVEKEKRIFTIQGWIIDGVQDYLIFKQAKTNWGIADRQIKRYIKEAYDRWKPDESISIEEKRHAKIAELKQLKRGMDEKYKSTPLGIRAIMAVEKEIIRLENIAPPRRVEVSGNPEKPLVVRSPFKNEEEEKAYLEFLDQKYGFK